MILRTAVDRVMQLDWRRGHPTIDDIRQALPVDGVTTADLANMVARVEEAGIPVGTDPALLESAMTEIATGREPLPSLPGSSTAVT